MIERMAEWMNERMNGYIVAIKWLYLNNDEMYWMIIGSLYKHIRRGSYQITKKWQIKKKTQNQFNKT